MNVAKGDMLGRDADLNKVDVATRGKFVFYGINENISSAWNRVYTYLMFCASTVKMR